MGEPIYSAADSVLGQGAIPRERRFLTPVAFDSSSTITDRYRQSLNFMRKDKELAAYEAHQADAAFTIDASPYKMRALQRAEENAVWEDPMRFRSLKREDALDEATFTNRHQAVTRKSAVMQSLRALDPLDPNYTEKVMEFVPDASYSRSVDAAIGIKNQQREHMVGQLDGVAKFLGESGIQGKKQAALLSRAEDLIRSKDQVGLGKLTTTLLATARRNSRDESRADAFDTQIINRNNAAFAQFEGVHQKMLSDLPPTLLNNSDIGPALKSGSFGDDVVAAAAVELAGGVISASANLTGLALPTGDEANAELAKAVLSSGSKEEFAARFHKDGLDASSQGGWLGAANDGKDKAGRDLLQAYYTQVRSLRDVRGSADRVLRMQEASSQQGAGRGKGNGKGNGKGKGKGKAPAQGAAEAPRKVVDDLIQGALSN